MKILVLAVSTDDGIDMRSAINSVYEGREERPEVVVATDPREVEALEEVNEFVMTSRFQTQRSIRMLLATYAALDRQEES